MRSYSYVWDHRDLFALPMLLVFIATLAENFLMDYFPALGPFFGSVMRGAIAIAFIVGVHRAVLLNETRVGFSVLRWDANFLRYLGTSLLIGVVAGVLMGVGAIVVTILVASGVPGLGEIVLGAGAFIAILLLLFRFILALPAAAIGEKDRFVLSWRATRGNAIRLFAVHLLISVPGIIFLLIFIGPSTVAAIRSANASLQPSPYHVGLAASLAMAVVAAVTTPALAVMLSLCYDVLVRGGGPEQRQDGPVNMSV